MSKIARGVQVLPSFPQDFTFNSQQVFQTFGHDPRRPCQKPYHDPRRLAACETNTPPGLSGSPPLSHNPSFKMGSQARPSYLPPITFPASPAVTYPSPSAVRFPTPSAVRYPTSTAVRYPTPSSVTYPTPPANTYSRAPQMNPPAAFQNEASSRNDPESQRQSRMGAGTAIAPDPRFGTDNIKSLNLYNFRNFHRGMEKSLVLFYTTPGPDKDRLKSEFETAADRVQVDGYGFGAVDCFVDNELCCREQVCKTPMLKLYSNGFQVSAIQEPSTFTAYQMEMLMKNTPVLTQPKAKVNQQMPRHVPRIIMGTRMLNR